MDINVKNMELYISMVARNLCKAPDRGQGGEYDFYLDRLCSAMKYGEKSGMEIVKTVCRCAYHDSVLTFEECVSIIKICHDADWHKIFMEVNFNEGWN